MSRFFTTFAAHFSNPRKQTGEITISYIEAKINNHINASQYKMTYTYDELNNILLKMQSLDYERYQNHTAVDILIELLVFERIADYWEVEWAAFHDHIYESSGDNYRGTITGCKLDQFLKPIISREEKVRILTFFRDHAQEVLFRQYYYDNVMDFRSYCAQLISKEIQQSRNDSYHGVFAEMPRPNLREIAQARPYPKLSQEYQIIADNIPAYPHDLKLFHPSIIVCVADEFTKLFRKQAQVHSRTQEKSDQPVMSIKQYKIPIRDRLIEAANRYLYFDEGPIYQTMWVICLMLRLIPKPNWWEEHCAENILNYLYCTKFFSETKMEMDATIQQIRQRTELTLPFDDLPVSTPAVVPTKTATPITQTNKEFIDQVAMHLQQCHNERPIIYVANAEIGSVENLIQDNHGTMNF